LFGRLIRWTSDERTHPVGAPATTPTSLIPALAPGNGLFELLQRANIRLVDRDSPVEVVAWGEE
jgi:hypothetical protein